MKLEIVQLKEALLTAQGAAAKPNGGRKDDFEKFSCDWQLVEKRNRGKCRSGRSGHSGSGVADDQQTEQTEPEKTKQRWHSVRALALKHPKQRRAGGSHPNSNTSPDGHGTAENRQVVGGVRRVWGTMRGCSYRTALQWLQPEQEWVNIESSKSWKLERCYQPVSASATHDLVAW